MCCSLSIVPLVDLAELQFSQLAKRSNNVPLQYNTALLPSVNINALGMFGGARHTPHTFTPIIKRVQVCDVKQEASFFAGFRVLI